MSLIEKLKNSTQDKHKEIERNPYTATLFQPDYPLETYTGYLKKLLGFHIPFEAAADGLDGLNVAEREKVSMLKNDLRFLNVPEDEIAAVPHCKDLPPMATAPQKIGALYVLEGSTLGGKYIKQQLEKRFGFSETGGLAYFASYGPRLMPMWLAFGQYADASAERWTEAEREEAADNARLTYDKLMDWLRN